jgi:KamA family protein
MTAIARRKGYGGFRAISRQNVTRTREWALIPPDLQEAVQIVSLVLPFRTNEYVMRELIDWSNIPDDPMFQLTFPQKGMLDTNAYDIIARKIRKGAPKSDLDETINEIRMSINPHPAGQMTHNVPILHGKSLKGVQHKYRQTVLFFPSRGQSCHAYCTFCFRWPQFVGMTDLTFASREVRPLISYLRQHPEVTDVIFTGGDPMVMKTKIFESYLNPLLDSGLDNLVTIRIGTKAIAYWPQRFTTDDDADAMLRACERVVRSGKNLAIMGHFTHPVELTRPLAREAVRRIRSTGANIYMQGPVVRHVNARSAAWADLWRRGMSLGCLPYYMFVERDTGASQYFEVPLARVWEIFQGAYQRVSGIGRTVRGPSMSAFPGKVHILGITDVGGRRAFMLEYLQCRDTRLARRPFFAKFDPEATWLDQLEPLTDQDRPFFPGPEWPSAVRRFSNLAS